MRAIVNCRSLFGTPGRRPLLAGLGAPGRNRVVTSRLADGGDPGAPGVLRAAAGTAAGVGPAISVMGQTFRLAGAATGASLRPMRASVTPLPVSLLTTGLAVTIPSAKTRADAGPVPSWT